MHEGSFDIKLGEISKVEGRASLDIKIRKGKVAHLKFKITEYKRFYTQAIRGKEIKSIPQMVSRICGTCSIAHLLCSIEAIEKALQIKNSKHTQTLRRLLMNGLIIRDHALHLYFFILPDLLGKDSVLDFDVNNQLEHILLDDAFQIKKAGNLLSSWIGGRSVHSPYPTIGGFFTNPQKEMRSKIIDELKKARDRIFPLIKILNEKDYQFNLPFEYVALRASDYNFLEGNIVTSDKFQVAENEFAHYLRHQVIPYSQASGYKFKGKLYLVGALSRINLSKDKLNKKTKKDLAESLKKFPSSNIYDNNLAQAIEILHCIDDSLKILANIEFSYEPLLKYQVKEAEGVGVIEAPRGLLYYKLNLDNKGVVKNGQIVVPTGQNQIAIERSILTLVEKNLHLPKNGLVLRVENLIRAFDPCLSCASHFLKVNWL